MKRLGEHCVRIGKKVYCEVSDHFIPHERNRYHPHVLQHHVLVGYSVILILVKVLALVLPVTLPSSSLYSSAITPENIIALTNQTRANLALPPLAQNAQLARAAYAKAEDMLVQQYFSHVSPTGATPWDWVAKMGYAYRYAGENLAVHYTSAEEVGEGWLASPSHRANIVNPRYTEIGVGITIGQFEGTEATVVVQLFGQPMSAPSKELAAASPSRDAVTREEDVVAGSGSSSAAPAKTRVAAATAPAVDESSIRVRPQKKGYAVRVAVAGARSVTAQLASQAVPLTKDTEDAWRGFVPYDKEAQKGSGEQLSVVAADDRGATTSRPLAIVAPETKAQQLYIFNESGERYAKFFGGLVSIGGLEDAVRRFYFVFLVLLGAALLLNIVIKIRVQHPKVISHAFLVITLTLVLIVV